MAYLNAIFEISNIIEKLEDGDVFNANMICVKIEEFLITSTQNKYINEIKSIN